MQINPLKRQVKEGNALQLSSLNTRVIQGAFIFNSFVNEESNFCCNYSVEGFCNHSPGVLSISWKVGIWIGVAFLRRYHSDSVQELVWKGQLHAVLLLVKRNKIILRRTCFNMIGKLTRGAIFKGGIFELTVNQIATFRFPNFSHSLFKIFFIWFSIELCKRDKWGGLADEVNHSLVAILQALRWIQVITYLNP